MIDFLDGLCNNESDLNKYEIFIKFREFCIKYMYDQWDKDLGHQMNRIKAALKEDNPQPLPKDEYPDRRRKAVPVAVIFPMDMLIGYNEGCNNYERKGMIHIVIYNGVYYMMTDELATNSTEGSALQYFDNFSDKMYCKEVRSHPLYEHESKKKDYGVNEEEMQKYIDKVTKRMQAKERKIQRMHQKKRFVIKRVMWGSSIILKRL